MQTVSRDRDFDSMIEALMPDVQALARRLRELINAVHPAAVEVVWLKQRIAGYGVGPKKMSEQYSYIAPQAKYVNLGFYYGTSLPDPEGLLEGSGKALRHTKVRTLAEADNPAVRQLLEAAVAERRRALDEA